MKILITVAVQLLSLVASAQFAIVTDKDGYSNIREEAKAGSKIVDTLKNGHFVFCFEKTGNWCMIDYSKNGMDHNAYIYSDRIKMIDSYQSFAVKEENPQRYSWRHKDIVVSISIEPFKKTTEKFHYYKDNDQQIEFINGKPFWGTDGGYPRTRYKSVTIQIRNKTITLPKAALENVFEPNLSSTKVFYDQGNDILYIHASNGDGAGSYELLWIINKGIYRDRIFAYAF